MQKRDRYIIDELTKQRRKNLRKDPTKAEYVLWQELRRQKLGYKFRRQTSIGKFIVDFYCHELRLIIEVDGPYHLDDWQKEYDRYLSFSYKEKELVKSGCLNVEGAGKSQNVYLVIKQKTAIFISGFCYLLGTNKNGARRRFLSYDGQATFFECGVAHSWVLQPEHKLKACNKAPAVRVEGVDNSRGE